MDLSAYIEERKIPDGWACLLVVKIPLAQAQHRDYAVRASRKQQFEIMDKLKGIIAGQPVSIQDIPEEVLTSMMMREARLAENARDRINATQSLWNMKIQGITKERRADLDKALEQLVQALGEPGKEIARITREVIGS